MDDDLPATLGGLFYGRSGGEVISVGVEEERQAVLRAELSGVPGLTWGMVEEAVDDSYRKLLELDLVDIFLGAWKKWRELQTYTDPEKHPHGEIAKVTLSRHTVKSKHKPTIEIWLGDRRMTEIRFDVELKLKLEAFVLEIRDAAVCAIESGKLEASGSIKCRGLELARTPSKTYRVPGKITLKESWPIPRL